MGCRISSLLTGLLLIAATAGAQSRTVDVPLQDGTQLRVTYYSPGKPGPAVILFHQCDMNRLAWSSLAAALNGRGIHVLTYDYRGVGDNRALPAEYAKHPGDADAALAFLLSQSGVDRDRIAAGGASCGVDRAVQVARRSGRITALVLLSGPTSDAGLEYIQNANVPVFFSFSADEGGPLPKMKSGVAASKNPATTIREFAHAGHGVPMFTAQPTLLPELADWLAKALSR